MAAVTKVVDQIRFDTDQDPDPLSILMPIQIRILQYGTVPQVYIVLSFSSVL